MATMNSKAMGIGQVFMFIVLALTFAVIAIFGFKAINDFMQKGEQVEFISFKTDLESAVKRIESDFGSVRIEPLYPPGKFESICFVNMDYAATDEELEVLCRWNPLACQVWEEARAAIQRGGDGYDAVDENVFLQPASLVPLKVSRIRMSNGFGFDCRSIHEGRVEVRLEGKGSHTAVEILT